MRARFRWAIPVMLLLILGMGLAIPVVDNFAHLGGFAAGMLLVLVVPPQKARKARKAPADGEGVPPGC